MKKNEAWEFFKLNFKWILVVGLFITLWLSGCFKRFESQAPTITHDTVVIVHEYQSAPYIPPVINVLPAKPTVINKPEYTPDTSSIQALRKQFNELVLKHTQQNIYSDTLKVDTIGWVNIKDTVSENKLSNRSFSYNIRERHITTTITQPYKPRNQVFIGGGINSPIQNPAIREIALGLLFKNKHDAQLGLSGTYDIKNNSPGAEIRYYKLIKL